MLTVDLLARLLAIGVPLGGRRAGLRVRLVLPVWTLHPKGPHLFAVTNGSPVLAFAGLWDRWRNPAAGKDMLSDACHPA